ncbi:MAG: haloacid dehalogenase type II [Deinococcales bacterium]
MKLRSFKVLTFDCYGTLIDWETGMVEALKPLTHRPQLGRLQLSHNAILEAHAKYESSQQRQNPHSPYPLILATVYKRLAESWSLSVSWAECLHYGQSVKNWPTFPDSAEALSYLKQHYKLVILSNVDNESFAASNEKLGVDFDAIYTAQDIGSYKPSQGNFDYMLWHLRELGYGKEDILHTAESMFHDHQPANKSGLASCWIYRRHAQEGFGATMHPGEMPKYHFRFNSMADMVKAHQQDL